MSTMARARAKETLQMGGTKANRSNKHISQEIMLKNVIVSEQPRIEFNEIDGLADSIKEHGLMNPIVVMENKEDPTQVNLIAGERRFRAFKQLNKITVPAIVIPYSDDKSDILAKQLIENIQREDLTPLEIAETLFALNETGLNAEAISKKVSKSKRSIYRYFNIAKLSPDIKVLISQNNLSINEIENRFLNNKPQEQVYTTDFIKKTKHTFKLNINKIKGINDYNKAIKEVETLLKELKSAMHGTTTKKGGEKG